MPRESVTVGSCQLSVMVGFCRYRMISIVEDGGCLQDPDGEWA